MCYYNFRCARPWGPFHNFNNVLSNLGYIVLGLIFAAVIGIRYTHWHKIVKITLMIRVVMIRVIIIITITVISIIVIMVIVIIIIVMMIVGD